MAPCLAEHIDSRKINKIMSDIKNILSKLDMLSEQVGFRPGARDFSGQRIEPKFDFSPVQDITPPMGAVGGTAKPRIKVQPGQSPRQAISQAQEKIPTLKQEIPSAKPSVDPYGRLEPKLGDMSKQQSFVGKRKDPGGPLPAASKSIEPTLEMNKFPGYLKGTDTAKDVEKKMVGMEEEMVSEYTWLDRATEKLKARDPYKTYEPDDQGFTFTPEQEKWLGGANRQDPDILKRMPGPKPPVSYFKNADAQRRAQELNFGRQNLNTVRSAVGKEKLAPEKFPTTRGGSGPIAGGSGLTPSVSLDDPTRTTSALPSDFKARMRRVRDIANAAQVDGGESIYSGPTPAAPAATVPSAAPAAVTSPVTPPSSTRPAAVDPGSGLTFYQDTIARKTGKAAAMGGDSSAQYYRNELRPSSVGAGPGPGLSVSKVNPTWQSLPARAPGSTGSGRGTSPRSQRPPSSSQQTSSIRNTNNYALSNIGNTSSMAENKHSIVNRLSRQFENYLDNRFDIVENNYVPKKKNLR